MHPTYFINVSSHANNTARHVNGRVCVELIKTAIIIIIYRMHIRRILSKKQGLLALPFTRRTQQCGSG